VIKRWLKSAAVKLLPKQYLRYRAYKLLIANESSFLYSGGWMESLRRERPCRTDGSSIPWMNYGVIRLLEDRLTKQLALFEYGSGHSTTFYARLVSDVTSVEYDKAWFDVISPSLPENARLIYAEQDVDGAYCRAILQAPEKKYDVVVVDGRDRVNCVRKSSQQLTSTGVLILDDSQRTNYADGISYMRNSGFLSLDFEGLKPTGVTSDRTTVFYRADNCLGL
jgi:hypothetical protein